MGAFSHLEADQYKQKLYVTTPNFSAAFVK